MAATNKCLAQSNKSGTGGEATKKRDAAHRARPQHRQEGQARALPMARMTEHDMIGWFNAAPMGSRQQRMLWVAHKIARLTGATKGSVYQMLERRLERAGPPPSGSSVQRQRRAALGRLGSLPSALSQHSAAHFLDYPPLVRVASLFKQLENDVAPYPRCHNLGLSLNGGQAFL